MSTRAIVLVSQHRTELPNPDTDTDTHLDNFSTRLGRSQLPRPHHRAGERFVYIPDAWIRISRYLLPAARGGGHY